jgi:hypothetical protein
MNSKEEFSKNILVLKFVEDEFNKNYPKETCPKWLNYDMFKENMIENLCDNLYDHIKNNAIDCIKNRSTLFTNWNCLFHIPIISEKTDLGDKFWNYFNELEIEIPKEIIRLVISDSEIVDAVL